MLIPTGVRVNDIFTGYTSENGQGILVLRPLVV